MSAERDVNKEKNARTYPAFGERLFSIAVENLPPGTARDKSAVVTFFRKEAYFGFDPTCTYAWLRGEVQGTKPLALENFKRLLLFYIGKNGLSSLEEINLWIASGPKRYRGIMQNPELLDAIQEAKIPSHSMAQTKHCNNRDQVWTRIMNLVYDAVEGDKHIPAKSRLFVIQGPPGIGKTLMLERLRTDPGIRCHFDEVFYSSCDTHQSPQTTFEFWLGKIDPKSNRYPGQPPVSDAELREVLQGRKILLLIDHVWTTEQIQSLKPFCENGCVVVVSTRSLEVARQVAYTHVIEMTTFRKDDVTMYYANQYAGQLSVYDEKKLFQLAEMVCYNPLGLDIALRRVAEEGWDEVISKLLLVPSLSKDAVFEDLHKPFWLAYTSLCPEDQDRFRQIGALPLLASYGDERLSRLWGISRAMTREVFVRLEKEAGLSYRSADGKGDWQFHPQVINFARCLLHEVPFHERWKISLKIVHLALQEKRPGQFHHAYKCGMKPEIARMYCHMLREERKRRRLPIVLSELQGLINPFYSTDWSIFTQLTSNCSPEDYLWGFHIYLEGSGDIWLSIAYLLGLATLKGLQYLTVSWSWFNQVNILFGLLQWFTFAVGVIWGFHWVLRGIRRRYDWAQLWQKVIANRKNPDIE